MRWREGRIYGRRRRREQEAGDQIRSSAATRARAAPRLADALEKAAATNIDKDDANWTRSSRPSCGPSCAPRSASSHQAAERFCQSGRRPWHRRCRGRALRQTGAARAGIARVLAHNPSAFTYYGTQTYLVGDDEVAVIDPGPDLPEHLDALVAGDRRPAGRRDHVHPHPPRPQPRGAAAGRARPARRSSAARRWRWKRVGPRADAAFDGDYAPDRVLADGEAIEVDGQAADRGGDARATRPTICASPIGGALFTGDHVMGWSTTVVVPPDGDMAAYMASLDKLRQRDDRIYYPAHGPAGDQPAAICPRPDRPPDAAREADPEAGRRAGARDIPDIVANAYPGPRPAAGRRGRRIGARASAGP